MSIRYVSWRITSRESDYKVVRYDDDGVMPVAVCGTMEEAWCAYEMDRSSVLADPLACETRSLECRVK